MRRYSKEQREEFWKKVCDAHGKEEVSKIVEEVQVQEHFDESTTIGERTYLPLSVWRKRGFPWKRIRQADDKHECPTMGTVYGALIRAKVDKEGNRNIWRETFGGSSNRSNYSSPTNPAGSNPETSNFVDKQKAKLLKQKEQQKADKKKEAEANKTKKQNDIFARLVIAKVSLPLLQMSNLLTNRQLKHMPDFAVKTVKEAAAELKSFKAEAEKATKGDNFAGFSFEQKHMWAAISKAASAFKLMNSMLESAEKLQGSKNTRRKTKVKKTIKKKRSSKPSPISSPAGESIADDVD